MRGGNGFKRAKGGYTVGRTTATKVAFHGATPVGQRAGAAQAVATDAATTQALCNELRAALVEKGLIKGSA